MPNLQWTDKRVEQLKQLMQLVHLAGTMDRGSGVSTKIVQCDSLSRDLSTDLFCDSGVKTSFLGFLQDLAIADREARNAVDKTDP